MTTGCCVLKIFLMPSSTLQAQCAELGAAMVDGRIAHRAQDAIGHRARSRDLQEVTASGMKI